MTTMLEITCRDPIVSRDSRPFGAGQGNRMRSLDWLLPSVLAGSLRTALGKVADRDFSTETAADLLQVAVAGPLPCADGHLCLPAPEDCVVHPCKGPMRAAPQEADEADEADKSGCDWPASGLRPVGLARAQASKDFKPGKLPAWWPAERYAAWLAGDSVTFDDRFFAAAIIDERTHVRIAPEAGAAEEGQLFTTAALALTRLQRRPKPAEKADRPSFAAITLSARVRAHNWGGDSARKLDTLHPLGGERRLAHWRAVPDTGLWNCDEKIRRALEGASRVRMALVTPAIFSSGWRPGWLDDDLVGTPPGAGAVLRLVGVSIQRWRAVSGWSLAELPGQPRGPKPVRRMVPAGGVYFFEIVEGEASVLADRWLEPVSDNEQDRRDGFGLAAWGVW